MSWIYVLADKIYKQDAVPVVEQHKLHTVCTVTHINRNGFIIFIQQFVNVNWHNINFPLM